jgi:pantoate--beta-alanine ligase
VAVSSRNSQLTASQRAIAPVFHRALDESREAALAGVVSAAALERVFVAAIGDAATIQYFAAVDGPTMTPVEEVGSSVRPLASIQIGSVRLVDNVGIDSLDSRRG